MTLIRKFFLMGAVVGVVLAISMGIALYGAHLVGISSTTLAEREIPVLNKAHQLKLAVVQVQQWLTDISATRGRDGLDDGFAEAEANAKQYRALLEELIALDGDNAEKYRPMGPTFEDYYRVGRQMAQAYIDQGPAGGNRMMGQFDEVAARMSEAVDGMLEGAIARSEGELARQRDYMSTAQRLLIGAFVILAAILGLMAFILWDRIRKLPVVAAEMGRIAAGDLSGVPLEDSKSDEIGQLVTGLGQMEESLKNLITEVAESSSQLAAAAEELSP